MKLFAPLAVCLLILSAGSHSQAASVEDWLRNGLLNPAHVDAVSSQLDLSEAQQKQIKAQLETARQEAVPMEQKVKNEQKVLGKLLQDAATTAEAASAQLGRLIEAETAVKQLQLRTLVAVRDVLTPEQQALARRLGPLKEASSSTAQDNTHDAKGAGPLMAKAEKLKAALQTLGIQPTEVFKRRGGEIETLAKQGDMKAAGAALDQLLADSRINELEAEPAPLDYSTSEPGSTDVDSLLRRYEDVQAAAQEVVSLPLLRELLQAKAAFEEAKAAQDAEQVGRILTYVEAKLKP